MMIQGIPNVPKPKGENCKEGILKGDVGLKNLSLD